LPSNYNIIISSPTHYGQLMTDGSAFNTTTFNVDGSSQVTSRLYNAVLGSTIGKVEHLSGSYDNMTWTLLQHDDNYDLSFSGISRVQTQASLSASALALRSAYGLQNVSFNNNLTNDCTLFDGRGICSSVTGAQHYLSGGGNNDTTSGTLTVAYRVNDQVRVGGYLDQNLNTSNVRGIHLDNGAPAFGAFAVWNANTDGLGVQVRLAAGYAEKDLTVTRQAVETTEAGSGKTALSSYGASAVASYAVTSWGDSILSPYAGIRYTKVTADAYTEAASVNVTSPLSYSSLTQNATTAMVGAKWTKPNMGKCGSLCKFGTRTRPQQQWW
jgi:hypothetical protein